MLAVAVANVKGGVGKTTLATHLAARFAAQGHATALCDLDRQRSSLQWLERRPKGAARITGVDQSREYEATHGYDRIVLDVPAALKRKDLEEVVRHADVLVVPMLPSVFDESGTERFLDLVGEMKLVRRNKRSIGIVANRFRPRTLAARQLEAFVARLDVPTVAHLRDAQVYANLAARGRTLVDEPESRHAALRAEWEPLFQFVDG